MLKTNFQELLPSVFSASFDNYIINQGFKPDFYDYCSFFMNWVLLPAKSFIQENKSLQIFNIFCSNFQRFIFEYDNQKQIYQRGHTFKNSAGVVQSVAAFLGNMTLNDGSWQFSKCFMSWICLLYFSFSKPVNAVRLRPYLIKILKINLNVC